MNRVFVEIKRITDPSGNTRLGAVVDLQEALSTPDIRDRLSEVEEDYQTLLRDCNHILTQIKSPKGKSDARLRWELAHKIQVFLDSSSLKLNLLVTNHTGALQRDLAISASALRYILKFHHLYKAGQIDRKINWSKYQELIDIIDDKSRKKCEELVRAGTIESDEEIREFRRKLKACRETT